MRIINLTDRENQSKVKVKKKAVHMKAKTIFKSEKKQSLLKKIHNYRQRGGTYSEIAIAMNKDKEFTLIGKQWTENYMYRFYTENYEK